MSSEGPSCRRQLTDLIASLQTPDRSHWGESSLTSAAVQVRGAESGRGNGSLVMMSFAPVDPSLSAETGSDRSVIRHLGSSVRISQEGETSSSG
ncbi:hypothetical protein EYF80_030000 [Liparis tanakae]|uniref:Uncharacterized protein n=1 Tax=Liparis tanakae TaxID=230148 RepID=A0A4Z2H3D6_9TELE|nr:hypothetical protein EYF80_030000 [Liparis tanakae]